VAVPATATGAAAGEPDLTPPTSTSADFEHLRWFDLPAGALD